MKHRNASGRSGVLLKLQIGIARGSAFMMGANFSLAVDQSGSRMVVEANVCVVLAFKVHSVKRFLACVKLYKIQNSSEVVNMDILWLGSRHGLNGFEQVAIIMVLVLRLSA